MEEVQGSGDDYIDLGEVNEELFDTERVIFDKRGKHIVFGDKRR